MNGGDLQQREAAVKAELAKFIKQHTGHDTLSAIDEIVLSYLVNILETLGSGGDEDAFDVDQFSEMMAAYLPSFININSGAVCEWMFNLAKNLNQADSTVKSGCIDKTSTADDDNSSSQVSLKCTSEGNRNKEERPTFFLPPIKDERKQQQQQLQQQQHSVRSRSKSSSSQSEDEIDGVFQHISPTRTDSLDVHEQLTLLTEMFPRVSIGEIQQCLTIARGNCDRAAQMLLQQEEQQQQVANGSMKPLRTVRGSKSAISNTEDVLQDKEFRATILQRYGYIDKDEDVREHRPVAPKVEPKKLIRYRDNKIVSVKGERYSEVKSDEGDDIKKTTYVTLKPARQYRFH